ncbi:MAG: Cell division-associated, ATP-dependent zinc metalloprotease FtsH [Ktedonobacterales bacterium]|jgi:cell division protease FtsH|nr:MAG: Cell division-associated, ATP-dependent zinc metalloprotease FtsH [Ktedonobacterales bacterium]
MFGSNTHRAQRQRDPRDGKPAAPAADVLRNNGGPPSPPPGGGPDRPQRPGPNGAGQPRGSGAGWISRLVLLLLLGVLIYNVVIWWNPTNSSQVLDLPYSTFVTQVQDGDVQSAKITDNTNITGTLKQKETVGGVTSDQFKTVYPYKDDNQLQTLLTTNGVQTTGAYSDQNNLLLSILINFVPILLIILLFVWLMRRAAQNQQNIFSFGRSRAKLIMEDRPSTTFADIAGVDEAKSELEEVVEFLKTPGKFQRLGGKIPKGCLLVGPPGTGKTLLARAVAGEAGVPFFSMSGSEFVEVLVGVGASRVRDLFDQAKKASPSIIFIDEIDAVGRQRGTSLTTNDEREQTLNQLLVEMDGFDARQAVVVIAATNRPDGLDQALLRPGRFDRRVTVDRPDWKGRQAILMIHARGVPLSPDVDLQQIARMTTGMVGADLANLVNEAALLAARRNLERVNMQCFLDALDRIQLGAERPLVLSEEDLRVVALHEAGHALVGLLTPHSDPVTKVTIVPRGQALGVTQYTPLDDRYNYSRDYLFGRIMTALGGRAAEDVVLGSITTGAENDLQQVTLIARNMVARWGMSSRIGLLSFSDRPNPFTGSGEFGQREYSEATAAVIDDETRDMVQLAYQKVREMLTDHKATLERIGQELRRHETLDARQLAQILTETGVSLAEVAPTPNAETIGLSPEPAGDGATIPSANTTPLPGSFPNGLGGPLGN